MPTFAIFKDTKSYARSTRMEHENITSVFGGVKLDFMRQGVELGDHQLRIISLYGDIRLRIPEEYGLRIDGLSSVSDVVVEDVRNGDEDTSGTSYVSENYSSAAVRIHVTLVSVFSELKIVRVPLPPGSNGPFVGDTARLLNEGTAPVVEHYDDRDRVGWREK